MPGATTARLVLFVIAIDWNAFTIPQTVPSNPINGATEPIDARKLIPCSNFSISLLRVICKVRFNCCANSLNCFFPTKLGDIE